jgi:hypothetical protein
MQLQIRRFSTPLPVYCIHKHILLSEYFITTHAHTTTKTTIPTLPNSPHYASVKQSLYKRIDNTNPRNTQTTSQLKIYLTMVAQCTNNQIVIRPRWCPFRGQACDLASDLASDQAPERPLPSGLCSVCSRKDIRVLEALVKNSIDKTRSWACVVHHANELMARIRSSETNLPHFSTRYLKNLARVCGVSGHIAWVREEILRRQVEGIRRKEYPCITQDLNFMTSQSIEWRRGWLPPAQRIDQDCAPQLRPGYLCWHCFHEAQRALGQSFGRYFTSIGHFEG